MTVSTRAPAARRRARRRHVAASLAGAAGAGAAAAALAYELPALTVKSDALAAAWGVRRRLGAGARRGIALTFDDGPHAQGTPAVLELLRAAGTHATFFLVGEQVARRPALAAEIAAAGHEIALHCDRHRNLMRLTPGQVRDDLVRATDRIAAATDRVPVLYRPPYGLLTAPAVRFARAQRLEPLLWSAHGRDWSRIATPRSVARRVRRGLAPGAVVLLHDADDYSAPDSWRTTVAALPAILDTLGERGLVAGAARAGAPPASS